MRCLRRESVVLNESGIDKFSKKFYTSIRFYKGDYINGKDIIRAVEK